jgi:DNA repair protein RecN (Recombination protein N)
MLTRLSVSNFAIIDELDIQFNKGLTIITGETGAGKSILLGALRLIIGERADMKQLNDETKKCIIEANFNISKLNLTSFFEENELDFDEDSILRRELLPSGKSRAFINDTPVTLTVLQELGEQLIDIHSQFNTSELLEQSYQMQILDAHAGQLPLVRKYQTLFSKRSQNRLELEALKDRITELSRESDYKDFLLDELKTAKLKADEWKELEQEQKELEHIDEIQWILNEIRSKLETPEFGILTQMNEINTQLDKISEFGEDLSEFSHRIHSVSVELDDIQKEIAAKSEGLEASPERLMEVNERIDLIHLLLNKHRLKSIEELIQLEKDLENDKSDFDQLEIQVSDLETKIAAIEKELKIEAEKISSARKKAIPKIEKEILDSLSELGMENSQLKIDFQTTSKFTSNGMDEISFLFSANQGSTPKPIGKTISGGERSRLMFAVKKSLTGRLELPTLILDEIDTGVSGKVANEVGNMMKEMAKHLQLITITHLPQVASKADKHLKVRKRISDGKTLTDVRELSSEEQIREIAELLSGSNITDSALKQAEELLKA